MATQKLVDEIASISRAAMAAKFEVLGASLQMLEGMISGFSKASLPASEVPHRGRRNVTNAPAEIVDEARAYLKDIPTRGALLDNLVDHVCLRTGYETDRVRSIILRNFKSNDRLVWLEDRHGGTLLNDMRRSLQSLGYRDVRNRVPLAEIPGEERWADLVAFTDNRATVLCYIAPKGAVEDPATREAAMFQAVAVDGEHSARFIWISDGDEDYFFDLRLQRVISELPHSDDVSKASVAG